MAPKTKTATWKPLTVKYDRPLVAVGNSKRLIPTAVRKATVGMEERLFLKLCIKERWLVAGVSGYIKFKKIGGLTRWTSLVAELKQALVNACVFGPITAAGSNEATTEAVSNEEALSNDGALEDACDIQQITAAGSNEATQEGDSNEQSLSDDEGLFTAEIGKQSPDRKLGSRDGRMKQRIRYGTNLCKGRVFWIELPATAPEKDPTCTDKRMVSLFCEDRKTLWLAANDAEWATRYIQDQLEYSWGRPLPQHHPYPPICRKIVMQRND